jgi:hypothetical protein
MGSLQKMKEGALEMFMKKYDKKIAFFFAILTVLFFLMAITYREFLEWAFLRHQNQLSWYIRPLLLIPFCYFALKKSWAGVSITIFCIFTSMFWFPVPALVNDHVKQFLEYEIQYLTSDWNPKKIMVSLLVPVSLFILGLGFWRRNLLIGLSVIIFIAVGKMLWSIQSAGESGKSIILPAILGLFICVVFIYWGFRRVSKKGETISKS